MLGLHGGCAGVVVHHMSLQERPLICGRCSPSPPHFPHIPIREGTSVGVRTRVRALGANADEHVRCSGVLHLPQRGTHHEHNPGRGFPTDAREGCMDVGGRLRLADTPRFVKGACRVVDVAFAAAGPAVLRSCCRRCFVSRRFVPLVLVLSLPFSLDIALQTPSRVSFATPSPHHSSMSPSLSTLSPLVAPRVSPLGLDSCIDCCPNNLRSIYAVLSADPERRQEVLHLRAEVERQRNGALSPYLCGGGSEDVVFVGHQLVKPAG